VTLSHPTSRVSRRRLLRGLLELAVGTSAAAVVVVKPVTGLAAPLTPTNSSDCDGWLTLGPILGLTPGAPSGFPYARRVQVDGRATVETGVAYALTNDGRTVCVVSNVCTHGGCRMPWNAEERCFICPCHQSSFSAGGQVLSAPVAAEMGEALRPLIQFPARVRNGQVQIWLG
jgi:menaquinol-cytochrome c reductase iron-sulfur subunit